MSNLARYPNAAFVPYNPDLSPWFRDPVNPITPPEGWFVLPENCATLPSDGYRQTAVDSWHVRGHYAHHETVKDDALHHSSIYTYVRRINDDPTLCARMQGWAMGHFDGAYWAWKDENGYSMLMDISQLPARSAPFADGCTTTPRDDPANPANFIVVVNNRALSNAVEQLALAHGLSWTRGENESIRCEPHTIFFKRDLAATPGMLKSNSRTGISVSGPTDVSWGLPRYDAATQFGEIVRLVTTPVKPHAPKSPILYGHEMRYQGTRASTSVEIRTVQFGCAEIGVRLLAGAFDMTSPGNRTVESITLSSGKTITREQAREILAYVAWADKEAAAKTGSQEPRAAGSVATKAQ